MHKTFFSFLIIFFCQSQFVNAQDADSIRLDLAKEVLHLTRATEAIEKMMPAMVEQQMQLLEQRNGGKPISEAQKAAAQAAVTEFMGSFSEAFAPLMEEMAKLYAMKFSREDLEALRDFYQSEVGKRFIQGGIELAPELARVSQTWSMNHMVPAAQKLGVELAAALKTVD